MVNPESNDTNSAERLLQRTGGKLIDVHAHYTPPLTEAERNKMADLFRAGHFTAPPTGPWTADDALTFMDSHGIAVQMLSYPNRLTPDEASRYNDFGATVVRDNPDRFGLLANLPLINPCQAVSEVSRAIDDLGADGFVLVTNYDGAYLGDPRFTDVFAALDDRHATVFLHPVQPPSFGQVSCGRPGPVIEFPMDTARTIVDAVYARVFQKFSNIKFVVSHAGGVLPTLAERVGSTGMLPWVSNTNGVAREDVQAQLSGLFYDTALAASPNSLLPLLEITSADHIVYGSDYPPGVLEVIEKNIDLLSTTAVLQDHELARFSSTATDLFPRLKNRQHS
ncbi:amidohydrolase family protein [Paenarthrobacter sp. A20]|uniref:amidohydrolase family protein n=1 Tax=Paenarthrobacter sp. A20 TaxID=2817891 RepID=UPI00209DA892|nr:amidohydrolase family protein [Paenarthrobacter sp. A20]MCP1415600.1 putative TIM-barrel fold metal-dependent hydrolase [Paenarthrobacter sp. A20]